MANASTRQVSPLRELRILRGLRLRDVSQGSGIADTVLSRLERGELELRGSWLERVAAFYEQPAPTLARRQARWARGRDGARTGVSP